MYKLTEVQAGRISWPMYKLVDVQADWKYKLTEVTSWPMYKLKYVSRLKYKLAG
jgi:hypothetical protein